VILFQYASTHVRDAADAGRFKMNIQDFLLNPLGKDWRKLLAYWTPPLPGDSVLWFVNCLGDIFYNAAGGAVFRLVVGTGAVEQLATDRHEFARLLDSPPNANAWLQIALVEGCRRAGISLGPDQCIGFKVPPALQGKYEVANLQATNIYSHYSWLAHLTKPDEIYWTGD
jgi:hypothetical protein